jgi:hypothetical protein
MTQFVGWIVGLFVGKSDQPDKRETRANNNLRPFCRECRVSATEERSGEFEPLRPHGRT